MIHSVPNPKHYLGTQDWRLTHPVMVSLQCQLLEGRVLTLTQWKFLFLLIGGRQQGLQGLHVNDELFVQGVGTAALSHTRSENRQIRGNWFSLRMSAPPSWSAIQVGNCL